MRHVGDAWKTLEFLLTSAGLCLDDNLGAVVTLAFYRFGGVANVVVKAASEVGLALGRLRSCPACWSLLYCAWHLAAVDVVFLAYFMVPTLDLLPRLLRY